MARGAQVSGGVRTSSGSPSPGAGSGPQPSKRFKYEYQSHPDFPELILTLAERELHQTPRGFREIRPRTQNGKGAYLDMIRFHENFLGTDDKELAERLEECELFGMPAVGGRFWRKTDMEKAQREARAAELRRELAADPELAKAALAPGDGEDFALPAPPAES